MLIGPELMALRADDTPQRQIQQRLVEQSAAWRQSGPGAELEADLAGLAAGQALAELPLLRALFTPGWRCDRMAAWRTWAGAIGASAAAPPM
jgi:hypothetical protein